MKIYEALNRIKGLKPSQYTDEQLVTWLSELDGQVWRDLLCHYETEHAPALPYNEKGDMNRELLIPFPHDALYVSWLGAQIDYHNAETDRYTNGMMMYNAQLQAFYNDYTRSHTAPVRVQIKGVKA